MHRFLHTIISGIGATGQAVILFHALDDSYPYKMMSHPSAEFYLVIARVGIIASPIAAVAAAWWLCSNARLSLPAVAMLLSPSVFLFIFILAHIIAGVEMRTTANFDQTTPMDVCYGFAVLGLRLAAAGVGVGTIYGRGMKALFHYSRRTVDLPFGDNGNQDIVRWQDQ
jgi:hypothetical protein